MGAFWQDLQYGLRRLLKSPGFAAVAVLTIALGIGACITVFSIHDALLLRLLPFPQPDRMVMLESIHQRLGSARVGRDDFNDWQSQSTVFKEMAYTSFLQLNLTAQSFPGFAEPERFTGTEVSAGFFPLLGVQPLLGRWFLPEEQGSEKNQVIILSYGLWRRRFGAKEDILGQVLTLHGRGYTVVGVMPRSFRFNEEYRCEFWVPMQHSSSGRFSHQYNAYARLKPGISIASAQTQLSSIAKRLEAVYPDTNTGWSVRVTPLQDKLAKDFRPALNIFFVAVGVVLLIACANVANLLLARATGRVREVAIRTALGASPFSILRLLLAESLLLAVAGAALGLVFTMWGLDLAAAAAPAWLELGSILSINRNVLGFTVLLTVLTGGLTGLLPALQAVRVDVNESLKQSGTFSAGARRPHGLSTLVVSEVALAAILLVAAGLLVKSYVRLLQENLGFRTENVLIVRLQLPWPKYGQAHQRVEFYRSLVERVRGLPGVLAAGATDAIPMGEVNSGGAIEIEGRPMPRDWEQLSAAYRSVTPDYFRALVIPLRGGRYFTEQDRHGSLPVIILNEALARQFFSDEDPLGKRIRTLGGEWRTIVGIVGDVRHAGPDRPARPETYSPHAQSADRDMFLAVRTSAVPLNLAGAVRAEIRGLDPDLPVMQVRTMDQVLSESVSLRRHIMALLAFFAAGALFLAALGLAGVMWYAVAQRTHEIGVRMALGAERSDVLRLVLERGLRLILIGLGIGLAAALGLTRLLATFLYGVTPTDPLTFAAVPALLVLVALAACWIPARRAAKVDPMVALRYE